METTEVVIAGAGPTGLMLACELRLAGIDVLLLDGLPARTGEARAGGVHARTMNAGHFGALPLDFRDFDTRYPYMLAVLQSVIERELDQRATESGAPVHWASPVAGFTQDAHGIEIEVDEPRPHRIRADYLVGCDGGRSAVRKPAGIGFPGAEATMTGMLADVELADPPPDPFFGRRGGAGDFSAVQFQPGWYRLVVRRHDLVLDRGATVTFEQFRDHYREIASTDFGMHSPRWVAHCGDAARQAQRYRPGRVFLAGDAARIHYPADGQGLNLGVQAAVNLGWKLAITLRGNASGAVLDSYETERLPVGARVLHNTRAQTTPQRSGTYVDALRGILGDLIDADVVGHRLGLMITALDIRHDTKGTHPLAGRRMPDLDLDGGTRVNQLLRSGRPMLLCRNNNGTPSGARRSGRRARRHTGRVASTRRRRNPCCRRRSPAPRRLCRLRRRRMRRRPDPSPDHLGLGIVTAAPVARTPVPRTRLD
ncbi:putative monooxygenase [Nocardia brasiliensis NBRC 14402]|nr:FAD-dependent monooxygenase [Nocardia brasiliensis]GAJ79465.1 putative monooxygenase [Nocardia brasiliensis NBRC 14402]